MGIKMGLVIAIGVWGGIKLDELFGFATPWLTILLSMVGVGAAIYVVIADTSKP